MPAPQIRAVEPSPQGRSGGRRAALRDDTMPDGVSASRPSGGPNGSFLAGEWRLGSYMPFPRRARRNDSRLTLGGPPHLPLNRRLTSGLPSGFWRHTVLWDAGRLLPRVRPSSRTHRQAVNGKYRRTRLVPPMLGRPRTARARQLQNQSPFAGRCSPNQPSILGTSAAIRPAWHEWGMT